MPHSSTPGTGLPWGLVLAVLAAAAFLLPPEGGCGEETGASVLLGLFTQHVDPSDDTNESSKLFGVGYRDYTVASFVNSYHDRSYFAGKRFHTRRFTPRGRDDWFVQGNLYAGMVYGYHDHVPNVEGFTPGLMPTVGFGYRSLAAEILYVPTPHGGVFMSFLSLRLHRERGGAVAGPEPGPAVEP